MAFSQAQLDAIEEAIAAGTTSVSYEGKSVMYRRSTDAAHPRDHPQRARPEYAPATVLVQHSRGLPGAR
jgi:hypothetical protein